VGPHFPALALTQADPAAAQTRSVVERMLGMGAQVWLAGDTVPGATALATPPNLPPETVPLAALQSFYLAIDRIARDRGLNPDAPEHLKKVTETT
jgi:glucosamine--fructose-6-phosphate aminotransferase (isomerizing)